MQILMNSGGIAMTNCFVVADEIAKEAVLFDAPDHTVGPVLDEVQKRGWELVGLWLTHGHFDHVADHAEVTRRFPGARVLIHKLDEPKLQQPNSSVFILPFVIPPRDADAYVEDGQSLEIGSLKATVLHTPGHSPGHVMYHFADEGLLVGGDLIIGGSVGRTDLPDSNHAQLIESIRRVMRFPHTTQLLPGHGQPGTLEYELQTNPFVQDVIGSAEEG
jgi:glyoxylase-like metal-dependent hydrolase (beta-lactamase superfamily II)